MTAAIHSTVPRANASTAGHSLEAPCPRADADPEWYSEIARLVAGGASPESAFAAVVPHARRKARGQFFTPPPVARAMARWACAHSPRSVLDPAVGPGIFLVEAAALDGPAPALVRGYDIDPVAIALAESRLAPWCAADVMSSVAAGIDRGRARSVNGGRGVELLQADFLSEPSIDAFDAILCNPPYVRHHDARLPDFVFAGFDAQFGVRLSRLTNTYCLFLLKILASLSPRGRAAVITPSEFLNADFGRAVKRILLESGRLRGFVCCDYRESIFDGVLTTATITLLDARGAGPHSTSEASMRPASTAPIAFAHADSVHAVAAALESIDNGSAPSRAARDLDPAAKWATGAPAGGGRQGARLGPHRAASMRPLADFARCTRGIATGANDFFTLTDEEASRWRLPAEVLRPCVTKAAHVTGARFTMEDFAALRAAGRKCWLLDATGENANAHLLSAQSGSKEHGGDAQSNAHGLQPIARYLAHGEAQGIHQRYLTRHRTPWFAAERRAPADIWAAVFGRRRLRLVHNAAGVLSLTTFHAVYLRPGYRRSLPLLMVYFHSALFDRLREAEQRVYGDGLLKLEPRDVERLPVPDLDDVSELLRSSAERIWIELATSVPGEPAIQREVDALFNS